MKLSDFVSQKIADAGIEHVFMVTGGGAMHLNHSFGSNQKLECIFNHHEQACAIGAEAYYRLNNELALVNVTSGPGGTNAITGVYGAYVDSIGMLIISGQVKYETTVASTGLPLRQYGDQELDIVTLVRPITKYATMVTDPKTIRYHIEKALYLAKHGRPGPCWLDIPLNVQAAEIDPNDLDGFDPSELANSLYTDLNKDLLNSFFEKLSLSTRPVLMVGSGVRLSGAHQDFIKLVNKLDIPVVTAWNAHDVIWNAHKNYIGRPGTIGDRAGNFAVQNSDLLIVLGSRLNIRQVSYNWNSFAREAYKIWVDIDPIELKKPSVVPDMPIVADIKKFISTLLQIEYSGPTKSHRDWLAWCQSRTERYPVVEPAYWNNRLINPYCFVDTLFKSLQENAIIVTGNGSACVVGFQAAYIKTGQRLWTNSGCATMGYDLPAAIGACKASGGKRIICLAGDGSIMMNLQELQTISGLKLPISIFILNNNGYVSIFQTHRNFFNGVEIGGGPKSGVSFPKFKKIAQAFDIPYLSCNSHEEMNAVIEESVNYENGPIICEVFIDENIPFAPKLGAKQHPDGKITSPPLEDLSPFLSREEMDENMIIRQIVD